MSIASSMLTTLPFFCMTTPPWPDSVTFPLAVKVISDPASMLIVLVVSIDMP
jgi:hypothetical protein